MDSDAELIRDHIKVTRREIAGTVAAISEKLGTVAGVPLLPSARREPGGTKAAALAAAERLADWSRAHPTKAVAMAVGLLWALRIALR